MSVISDEGLNSLRDLFEDSSSDVSIHEVFDDTASEADTVAVAKSDSVGSGSVLCSTPVKRRVRVIAPRSTKGKFAANFSEGSVERRGFGGGSVDRRGFRGSRGRFSPNSPAGDLELPPSSTWSNGARSGFHSRQWFVPAASWDSCPVDPVDIREAVSLKGRRNNRAMAEQVVGKLLFVVVVVFMCCFRKICQSRR